MQELNEYFQSLKVFSDGKGVEEKEITFYIRNDTNGEFQKFKIGLAGLKPAMSADVKQKHYLVVIDSLMDALDQTLDRVQPEQNLSDDEGDKGY